MEEDGTDFQFSLLLMFYEFKFSIVIHSSVIFAGLLFPFYGLLEGIL